MHTEFQPGNLWPWSVGRFVLTMGRVGAAPRITKTLCPRKRPRKLCAAFFIQKGLEVCCCFWGVPSKPSPGSDPGPVQVPSRVRSCPVQIRHVPCFTVFRTHPGPEVGAILARPGPILVPSVPLDRAWTGRNRLLGHFRFMAFVELRLCCL